MKISIAGSLRGLWKFFVDDIKRPANDFSLSVENIKHVAPKTVDYKWFKCKIGFTTSVGGARLGFRFAGGRSNLISSAGDDRRSRQTSNAPVVFPRGAVSTRLIAVSIIANRARTFETRRGAVTARSIVSWLLADEFCLYVAVMVRRLRIHRKKTKERNSVFDRRFWSGVQLNWRFSDEASHRVPLFAANLISRSTRRWVSDFRNTDADREEKSSAGGTYRSAM